MAAPGSDQGQRQPAQDQPLGRLAQVEPLQWRDGFAAMVVLAAEDYPQAAKTGRRGAGPQSNRLRPSLPVDQTSEIR